MTFDANELEVFREDDMHRTSSKQWTVDTLKERTDHLDIEACLEFLADHLNLLNKGSEAEVYELGPKVVIKASERPANARAEYVIFSDPRYDLVTPDVYGHHEQWAWIAVERVRPIEAYNWDIVESFFQDLTSLMEETGPHTSLNQFTIHDVLSYVQDGKSLGISSLDESDVRSIWNRLRRDEKIVIQKIVDLYDDLGQDVADVSPKNFGIDLDKKLVLIDISTHGIKQSTVVASRYARHI